MAVVAFDCKTATITMKPEATLTRAAIEAALKGANFGVADVAETRPATIVVLRATLRPLAASDVLKDAERGELSAEARSQLATELPRELRGIQELFLEPDGRVTALLRDDPSPRGPPLDEATFTSALKQRQVSAAALESLRWPQSAAACVATLRKVDDAAARLRARAAIENVNGVLAAFADAAGPNFIVFTREPCANLEAKLKEALGPAGFELARLEPRTQNR